MLWPVPALHATMYLLANDDPEAIRSAAEALCMVLITNPAEIPAIASFLRRRIKTFLS
jgi:hypothetical protein